MVVLCEMGHVKYVQYRIIGWWGSQIGIGKKLISKIKWTDNYNFEFVDVYKNVWKCSSITLQNGGESQKK
jgi:hypothetical protein